MTPYQIQRLLKIRKALEDEINQMAETPRVAQAVAKSRDGKGKGYHLKAAQSSIRLFEGMEKMLFETARIKKLPKPRYPGGKRV